MRMRLHVQNAIAIVLIAAVVLSPAADVVDAASAGPFNVNRFNVHNNNNNQHQPATTAARKFLSSRGSTGARPNGWLRSIPALMSKKNDRTSSSGSDRSNHTGNDACTGIGAHHADDGSIIESCQQQNTYLHEPEVLEVAVKTRKKRKSPPAKKLLGETTTILRNELAQAGTYYGLTPSTLTKVVNNNNDSSNKPPRISVHDTMSQTLQELKTMRQEMEALRKDMYSLRRSVVGGSPDEEYEYQSSEGRDALLAKNKKRLQDYEQISADVERWAEKLLFQDDHHTKNDAWSEVHCNKVMRHLNSHGRTRAYVKWMKDSRGSHANPDDDRVYPCLKIYSTVDAPIDQVCTYLAQEQKMEDYNDLVVRHGDVEELAPDAKICFGRTPKILFIKPREFITFCRHRWTREGVQIMVNQACHEESVKAKDNHNDGDLPRAFALRGAHFISPHPDDPEKTQVAMIAHGNPGMDIPDWAIKTAIKAVAPIEPFKLFHKINKGVQKSRSELTQRMDEIAMAAATSSSERSHQPAGMAQLGFACFWPNGGGIQEGWTTPNTTLDDDAIIIAGENEGGGSSSQIACNDDRP